MLDKSIESAILEAIDLMIESRIKQTEFDITQKGVVVRAMPYEYMYYVEVNGDVHKCKARHGQYFQVDDIVLIKTPAKDTKDRYIIGLADSTNDICGWSDIDGGRIGSSVFCGVTYNGGNATNYLESFIFDGGEVNNGS